jgi:hypothetical protein
VLDKKGKFDSSSSSSSSSRGRLTRPTPDFPSSVEFGSKDPFTGEPVPPSGTKYNFKSSKDAKQFLSQLGPELTDQLVVNAGNLNEATVEAGVAALEPMLNESEDMVSPAAVACLQDPTRSLRLQHVAGLYCMQLLSDNGVR